MGPYRTEIFALAGHPEFPQIEFKLIRLANWPVLAGLLVCHSVRLLNAPSPAFETTRGRILCATSHPAPPCGTPRPCDFRKPLGTKLCATCRRCGDKPEGESTEPAQKWVRHRARPLIALHDMVAERFASVQCRDDRQYSLSRRKSPSRRAAQSLCEISYKPCKKSTAYR